MAGRTSRDIALLLRKGAQFAAGFSATQGAPDVSTGGVQQSLPAIGERLRGGFSAISPGFREFEESRAKIGESTARTGQILEERKQLQLDEERESTPFDIRKLTGVADPKGDLGKVVEQELVRVGADIDGNGVVTQKEFNKALNSGNIDFSTIDTAFGDAITRSDTSVSAAKAAFKPKLDAINKKQIEAGQPPFTENDFNDPDFRATFSSEAIEFDKIASAEQRNTMLKEKQKMVSRFAEDQRTAAELDEAEIQKIAREETGGERTQAKRLFKERTTPRGAPTRASILTGVPLNTALRSAKARIDRGEDEDKVISEVILSDNRFALVNTDIIRILRKSKSTDDFFTQITNLISTIQGGGGTTITIPREPIVEGADVLTEGERAEKERLKAGGRSLILKKSR